MRHRNTVDAAKLDVESGGRRGVKMGKREVKQSGLYLRQTLAKYWGDPRPH
ncbi:MAG TPA: hypothetical protein VGO47_06970 [Chlamydiales bacterium]|nr:hypothetical protein [Chlamydiales bacterium]